MPTPFSLVHHLGDILRVRLKRGKAPIYISKRPTNMGGGANTFTGHFIHWAGIHGYPIVRQPANAHRAIVIANIGDAEELAKAKEQGCFVIHRIDEYFEKCETPERRLKHDQIIALNKLADITVFQSRFVKANASPYIRPLRDHVILNGGDPRLFQPGRGPAEYVGHVTWSVAERKRLDLLHEAILQNPDQRFLLVGRHTESPYDFRLPNVTMCGVKDRKSIAAEFRRMKILYFPSEDEPCPNTPIEAILSGVPICFNNSGGTPEIVRDCGEPLNAFRRLLGNVDAYRRRCLQRSDLSFDRVFGDYLNL